MSKKLDTEILINLSGNLTAKARQYGASMSDFAQRNQRAMSIVKATSDAAGRGLDRLGNRYTAAVAGFGGSAMLRNYTNTERQLTKLGIVADKTRAQMKSIYADIRDESFKVGIDPKSLLGVYETINGMTGEITMAVKNKETLAQTIAATGSDGESLGTLVSQFPKFSGFDKENQRDFRLAVDGLNRLGKEGSYELGDMAKYLPSVFSAAAAMNQRGVKGIIGVGVLAEAANDLTGNAAISATHIQSLFTDLQRGKTEKGLKDAGIRTRDKDGGFRDVVDVANEIAQKSLRYSQKTGKSQTSLLEGVGFTDYSVRLLQSLSTDEQTKRMKRYRSIVADGNSIIQDAKYAADDFASSLQRLSTSWDKFSDSQLAGPVRELADAINSVDQDSVQNWLEIGKNIAVATAGLLVARKAFQIGKGTYDFLRPGKKGVPKDVTDAFGSGVTPVYVVNMGAGGMGGAVGGKAKGKGVPLGLGGAAAAGTALGSVGFWGLARAAGTGAAMVYMQNEAAQWAAKTIYDSSSVGEWAKGSSIRSWVDESVDKSQLPAPVSAGSVWGEIKDWLTSTPAYQDPAPWASLQPQNQGGMFGFGGVGIDTPLKIDVDVAVTDDRAIVKSIRMPVVPRIQMRAESGPANVEQD